MLTDSELIEELNSRLAQTRQALQELSEANRALVVVNDRLRESEALKSNFLSNIRNEINNPLNAIMGLASEIRSCLEDNHPLAPLASSICYESQDLNFQLSNIIAAADLESGEFEAEIGLIDVILLMQGVVDTLMPHITAKQIFIEWETGTDSILFVTDAAKLNLICSNLLDNAVKFSHESGIIIVRAWCDSNELTVTVTDFGIGIAPENHDKIFDRFLQLDSGSTRAHRGHGLGLSIVKALLDILDGTLKIESSSGAGTTFSFTIPRLDMPEDIDIFAEDANLIIFDQTGKM